MDVILEVLRESYRVEAEYRFHPVRRWRFDYAIPEHKIAIEIEGGAFVRGRHTRGVGYLNDMEKYNEATIMGWRILRYKPSESPKQMLNDIERILNNGGWEQDKPEVNR